MTKTRFITYSAAIAALYAVLTVALSNINTGFRISEALTVLAGMTPAAIPGLFVGCLVANIICGAMPVDIVLGSLTTLVAAFLSYKLREKPMLIPLPPVVLNALVVGTYLYYIYGISEGVPIWSYMLTVGAGQFVSCYVVGLPLYFLLKKYTKLFNF